MEFNITLVLQIINFLITYTILNHFFFKPIINALRKKKAKEQKLLNDITSQEKRLYESQQKKLAQLDQFQKKVAKERIPSPPLPKIFEADLTSKRDKKEIKKLINQAKKIIVERVPHVD